MLAGIRLDSLLDEELEARAYNEQNELALEVIRRWKYNEELSVQQEEEFCKALKEAGRPFKDEEDVDSNTRL